MKSVKIIPGRIEGRVSVPPSKSISHRAIIGASLTNNRISNIKNVLLSEDIMATCEAVKDMGAEIERIDSGLNIKGNNLLNTIKSEIDCKLSETTLRFLIPVALITGEQITFKGDSTLKGSILAPYIKVFKDNEIIFDYNNDLPLKIQGMLSPGIYEMPGNISSQFITGLMFVLPLLGKDSKIVLTTELESRGYIDLTIEVLNKFSIKIENYEYKEFYIKGNQEYKSANFNIEGDLTLAAYWISAGIIGGNVRCTGLSMNSIQGDKQILDLIQLMGGKLLICNGEVVSVKSKTTAIEIDATNIPDLVPILSVVCALSEGTSRIFNAGRLRFKQCDRLKALSVELSKIGANILETEDGVIIKGVEKLSGGVANTLGDAFIGMALAVAAIKAEASVTLIDVECINKFYPSFFKDLEKMGVCIEYESENYNV